MIADRVGKLRVGVEIAHELAQLLEGDVAAGRLARRQAIEQFQERVYAMRYNGGNALFAYDIDGVVIAFGDDLQHRQIVSAAKVMKPDV